MGIWAGLGVRIYISLHRDRGGLTDGRRVGEARGSWMGVDARVCAFIITLAFSGFMERQLSHLFGSVREISLGILVSISIHALKQPHIFEKIQNQVPSHERFVDA